MSGRPPPSARHQQPGVRAHPPEQPFFRLFAATYEDLMRAGLTTAPTALPKRGSRRKYVAYVVFCGRVMGVFFDWFIVNFLTSGYPHQNQEGFRTIEEARLAWDKALVLGTFGSPVGTPHSVRCSLDAPFSGYIIGGDDDESTQRFRRYASRLPEFLAAHPDLIRPWPKDVPRRTGSSSVTSRTSPFPPASTTHVTSDSGRHSTRAPLQPSPTRRPAPQAKRSRPVLPFDQHRMSSTSKGKARAKLAPTPPPSTPSPRTSAISISSESSLAYTSPTAGSAYGRRRSPAPAPPETRHACACVSCKYGTHPESSVARTGWNYRHSGALPTDRLPPRPLTDNDKFWVVVRGDMPGVYLGIDDARYHAGTEPEAKIELAENERAAHRLFVRRVQEGAVVLF
ncbi:hypothetical protein D9611_013269 [Ephemerocybe angulata]|uniref:Ribonuclease H1 N-terminal domain-containing protein n=1 Tax=Ephemerocybe angulata TaxID=980116 RepID=A0A8H5FIY4_9AGAR|nr:hypothetical protein D9611_013269 [Tulosesus angulatus]